MLGITSFKVMMCGYSKSAVVNGVVIANCAAQLKQGPEKWHPLKVHQHVFDGALTLRVCLSAQLLHDGIASGHGKYR